MGSDYVYKLITDLTHIATLNRIVTLAKPSIQASVDAALPPSDTIVGNEPTVPEEQLFAMPGHPPPPWVNRHGPLSGAIELS